MDSIRNSKKVIENAIKQLNNETDKEPTITDFEKKIDHLLTESIDSDIIDVCESPLKLAWFFEELILKENLLKSAGVFLNVADLWNRMKNTTKSTTKKALEQGAFVDMKELKKSQRKKLQTVTEKLIESFYFDYSVLARYHYKLKTKYSRDFFNDVIASFKLTPNVERLVKEEFKPVIRELKDEIKRRAIRTVEKKKNKDPDFEPDYKKEKQFYYNLEKRDQVEIERKANEIVAKIIGFSAAVSIGEYFKTRVDALESAENIENEEYLNESVDNLSADYLRNPDKNNLFESQYKDSIYSTYVNKEEK